jgi:hypothetical protein
MNEEHPKFARYPAGCATLLKEVTVFAGVIMSRLRELNPRRHPWSGIARLLQHLRADIERSVEGSGVVVYPYRVMGSLIHLNKLVRDTEGE